jgi:hypothetical protein
MNYKIIDTGSEYPDVLLYRTQTENSDPCVNIFAIGYVGGEETAENEEVIFDTVESCQRFIQDYSDISAIKWVQYRDLTYTPIS